MYYNPADSGPDSPKISIDQKASSRVYTVEANDSGYYGYSVTTTRIEAGTESDASGADKYIDNGALTSEGQRITLNENFEVAIDTGIGASSFFLVVLKQRPITYSLSLDNNGATSTAAVTYGTEDAVAAPTRSGYRFAGWNTEADGSGDTIETLNGAALAKLPINDLTFAEDVNTNAAAAVTETIALYAQWKKAGSAGSAADTSPEIVSPKTGDDSMLLLTSMVLAVSAAAFVVIGRDARRKGEINACCKRLRFRQQPNE